MKIALLFLTRKELNHSRIWQQMLEEVQHHFNVYIHSKEPLEDPFFKKFRIAANIPTSYLVHGKAWQLLLQEALKDASNIKFIYLSESCMPLYPLSDLYHYLVRDSNTYMRYSVPWWPRDGEREVQEIPNEHRWGNAEWIILNTFHARLIANDREILNLTSKYINSDHEAYPSSLFSLKGCLDQVIYRLTTYANFSTPVGPHPYHFSQNSEIEDKYLWQAKRGGCLFARKFNPEFPSEKLIEIANQRLISLPSSNISQQLKEKIVRLQTQEEMSLANSCVLLPMILNEGFFDIGYEVGVGIGLHMERLLQGVFLRKFFGIDEYRRKSYQGIFFTEEEEDRLYLYVQERIKKEALDADLIRASSLKVAESLQDQVVDFVHFNLEYNEIPIEENLRAWFPKLKPGGVISGVQTSAFYPHLQTGIENFFFTKGLEVHQEFVEPKFWWVQIV